MRPEYVMQYITSIASTGRIHNLWLVRPIDGSYTVAHEGFGPAVTSVPEWEPNQVLMLPELAIEYKRFKELINRYGRFDDDEY